MFTIPHVGSATNQILGSWDASPFSRTLDKDERHLSLSPFGSRLHSCHLVVSRPFRHWHVKFHSLPGDLAFHRFIVQHVYKTGLLGVRACCCYLGYS